MNKLFAFGGSILFLFILSACKTATGPQFDPHSKTEAVINELSSVESTNRIDADWLRAPTEPFRIGPGDRLEIEIFGDPTSRAMTVVGPDGRIYYHLFPGLDIWGLTLDETRQLIRREMGKLEDNPPDIGITLRGVESRRVWLLGRFNSAGVYPLSAPMTLLEAIAVAGGSVNMPGSVEEAADLQHSFIVRRGQLVPVNFDRLLHQGDLSQNVYLEPDDFIYFPSARAKDVYVLGAVRIPKSVSYMNQVTLVSAVAAAGGTIKDAYLSHVAVVRGSLAEPKIAIVNYRDVVQGKAPDVRLEPRDIVFVPFTPYRTLTRYADLILTTFVRAVAINEGARAASGDAIPVGVNIGIGTISPAP